MRLDRRHAWQDDDDLAGRDPSGKRRFRSTIVNGGIINALGTNAKLGAGDWMVVEADESDGTFLKLPTTVAIVTNIDPEHLDHFKTFEAIKEAFRAFVENLPFYGFAVMCLDHPTVQELVGKIEDRRVITYGENPQADARLTDIDLAGGVSKFRVSIRDRKTGATVDIPDLGDADARPPQRAERDRRNRGRIRARHAGGCDPQRARIVRRRKRDSPNRGNGTGVNIRRLWPSSCRDRRRAARGARVDQAIRVIAVMQPHRYTRLSSLFNDFATCFNDADSVIIAPVYAAGEPPMGRRPGWAVAAIKAHGIGT